MSIVSLLVVLFVIVKVYKKFYIFFIVELLFFIHISAIKWETYGRYASKKNKNRGGERL